MKTLDNIYESLNKPASYKWSNNINGDYPTAKFFINKKKYIVGFGRLGSWEDNKWDVAFGLEGGVDVGDAGEFGITDTGDQFKVFATIIKIVKEFFDKRSPEELQFSAEEPSRRKLYSSLIKKYAKNLNVKLVGTEFTLSKKSR